MSRITCEVARASCPLMVAAAGLTSHRVNHCRKIKQVTRAVAQAHHHTTRFHCSFIDVRDASNRQDSNDVSLIVQQNKFPQQLRYVRLDAVRGRFQR